MIWGIPFTRIYPSKNNTSAAAMVVLAVMILPSIIKVSITALEAVPKEYEDASLALGATSGCTVNAG